MPDELLTVFKLCFLALLYLFFFRVLRAVWTEVTASMAPAPTTDLAPTGPATPEAAPVAPKLSRRAAKQAQKAEAARAPRPTRADAPPEPRRLVALEPPNLAGIEYVLTDGMSIGRSEASTVAIDDSFLSGRHASFARRDGAWVVEDLGSTNGTYVNRQRVERLVRLTVGDHVQLGNVVLEVR